MLNQDLHIHTTYSAHDSAVVPEQTIDLVARLRHAKITGISDHFEYLVRGTFESYEREIRAAGFKLGAEVDGSDWAKEAAAYNLDYYIVHCYDRDADYGCLDLLLATNKPVIIAHPNALETNLNRVPAECLIEINNRYIWRCNWHDFYKPFTDRFRFILSSDAHQPNCLSHVVARLVLHELSIKETILF